MEILLEWVYDNHWKPLHDFAYLGDSRHGCPQTVEFKAGTKMLAVIVPKYNVVLPCEITKDTVMNDPYDRVPVKCFVRVEDEFSKMAVNRSIMAILLFPYHEFEF